VSSSKKPQDLTQQEQPGSKYGQGTRKDPNTIHKKSTPECLGTIGTTTKTTLNILHHLRILSLEDFIVPSLPNQPNGNMPNKSKTSTNLLVSRSGIPTRPMIEQILWNNKHIAHPTEEGNIFIISLIN